MAEIITIKQEHVDHDFDAISQPDQNIDVNQEKITLPVEVKNELEQGAQYPVYIVQNANLGKPSCDFIPQQTYSKEITIQPLIICKNDPEIVENTPAEKLENFGNDLQIMPPSNTFSGLIGNFEQQKLKKSHQLSMNTTWEDKGQNLKKETDAAQKDQPSTQKNFRCSLCRKRFDSEKALKTHFFTHIPKQIKFVPPLIQRKSLENGKKKHYSTSIDCGQGFNRNIEQNNHQYVLPFGCDLCGLKYKLKHTFKKHMESVHQVYDHDHDYHCSICSASFYCNSHLTDHMKMHNKDKLEENGEEHITEIELPFEHVCSICGVSYKTEHYLKKHMKIEHQIVDTEISDYKCLTCPASFHCKGHLIDHQKIHKDDKLEKCHPFTCEICPGKYHLKHNFKKHMEMVHQIVDKDSNDYNCSICSASFYYESYLKDHQKIHKQYKPFKCDICGECFKTTQAIGSHANSHDKDKTKKCHYCDEGFKTKKLLKEHLTLSIGDGVHVFKAKEFLCNICAKNFFQRGTLNRHMKSHSEEKKFPCDICGKKFKQKEHLRGHFEVHFRQKEQAKAHYMYYCKLELEEIERALGNVNKTEFSCADCDLVFETDAELKAHTDKGKKNADIICEPILTDLEKKELSCKICLKVFDSREDFQQHYHPGLTQLECEICLMKFGKPSQLQNHTRTHVKLTEDVYYVKKFIEEGMEKIVFVCCACQEELPDRRFMDVHILLKNGEGSHKKPELMSRFQCDICFAVFKSNAGLLNHQRVHHQAKTYLCDECGKEFSLLSDFTQHKLSLHVQSQQEKKKKVQCYVCNLEFDKPCELKVHIIESIGDGVHKRSNTHATPGQKWECSFCDVVCPNKTGLALHMQRKHETETQVDNSKSLALRSNSQNQEPNVEMDIELSQQYSDNSNCRTILSSNSSSNTQDNVTNLNGSPEMCCEIIDIEESYSYPYSEELASLTAQRSINVENSNYSANLPPQLQDILEENQKSTLKPTPNLNKISEGNKVYTEICGECFKTKQAVSSHANSHVKDKTKKCQYCDEGFKTRKLLKEHLTLSIGDGIHFFKAEEFLCNICTKIFSQLGQLNRHMKSHSEERKFPCDICGKKFKQKEHLRGHFEVHFRQKEQAKAHYMYYNKLQLEEIERALGYVNKTEFSCADCDLVFETDAELKAHSDKAKNDDIICEPILTDLEKKELSCKICFKVFDSREDFQQHYHPGLTQECEICLMKFGKPSQLQNHTRTHVKLTEDMFCVKKFIEEGTEKIVFVCCACQEELPDRRFMDVHILLKNGEGSHKKPELMSRFQCDICFAVFKSNAGLLNHQRVHHQAKTYLCDECGKEFSLLSDFTQHKLSLHVQSQQEKKKKVQCYVCNLEFDKPCELKVHIIESIGDGVHKRSNTHATRGQKWECSFCDVVCPNKTGLTLHMQRKHLETGTRMDNSKSLALTSNSQNQEPNVDMDIELSQQYSDNSNCSTILSSNSSSNTQDNVTNLNGSPEMCCEIIDIEESHSYPYSEELASLTAQRSINVENSNYSANLPPQLQDILEENQKSTSKPTQNLNKISEGNKVYTEICGECFKTKQAVSSHANSHVKDKTKKCQYCDEGFKTRKLLKEHLTLSIGDGIHFFKAEEFLCNICTKIFSQLGQLNRHMKSHSEERKFPCDICGKKFKQKEHLRGHFEVHFRQKEQAKAHYMYYNKLQLEEIERALGYVNKTEFSCADCDLVFETDAELKAHSDKAKNDDIICEPILTDLEKKELSCKICFKVFDSREDFQQHYHPGLTQECEICLMKFGKPSQLQNHTRTHVKLTEDMFCVKKFIEEGTEKIVFVCCACQEELPDRRFMDVHILLKNGEGSHKKPELMSRFQCDICFAVFKSNAGLLNHQRVHHQAKTYLCDECGKEFSLLSDFTQHKLSLHVQSQQEKKKKVQCYVCNLEFDKPCELKVHIIESIGDGVHKRSNTHATRGQKWECSFCDVVCPNKTGLTLHMQRKHLETGTRMDNSKSLALTSNSQNQEPNVDMDIELSQQYSDNSNCSTILSSNSSSNTQDNVTNLNGSPEMCCEIIDIEESHSYPYSEELASLTAQRSITVENSNYSANLPPQLQDILEENQKSTSKPTQNLNKISERNKVYTDKGLRFKCHLCPKLSINFENLKKHMRVHSMHSEKLYCGKCGKSFNNENGLKNHTENQYQCTKCPQRFCRAIDFKKHHRQHQLENKLQCPHCPKWFISEVHYKYHVGSHTGEKMFKCTLCQRAFKDTYGLTVHMRRHKKEKQYMCHNCGKCFIDLGSLRMHNKIHNEKKEIHKCDQCDKQYAHKESLKYHVRKQHQNERLKCNLCNKTFIHTANLRIHERQHTGIKPFECDVCGKTFYTKFLLQTHANIHSRVKKFTCDICGKQFAQSAALYTHKKNVHIRKK